MSMIILSYRKHNLINRSFGLFNFDTPRYSLLLSQNLRVKE